MFIIVSVLATKPPSFSKAISPCLGSDYRYCVGLASSAALLADVSNNTLVKYAIDGSDAQKMFEKALPDGMKAECCKYLLNDGRIVLREFRGKDPTHIYTDNLTTKTTYKGDYGRLIGTLSPDLLIYAKKTSSSHGYEVHIYSADNNHKQVMTLKPSAGKRWYWKLSVCRHPYNGYMAVVNHSPNTLDIFNEGGWLCYHFLVR